MRSKEEIFQFILDCNRVNKKTKSRKVKYYLSGMRDMSIWVLGEYYEILNSREKEK